MLVPTPNRGQQELQLSFSRLSRPHVPQIRRRRRQLSNAHRDRKSAMPMIEIVRRSSSRDSRPTCRLSMLPRHKNWSPGLDPGFRAASKQGECRWPVLVAGVRCVESSSPLQECVSLMPWADSLHPLSAISRGRDDSTEPNMCVGQLQMMVHTKGCSCGMINSLPLRVRSHAFELGARWNVLCDTRIERLHARRLA